MIGRFRNVDAFMAIDLFLCWAVQDRISRRWTVIESGEQAERREVQLFKPIRSMGDYDPDAIPIEWRSWLNGHRQVAPTSEEMEKCESFDCQFDHLESHQVEMFSISTG